MAETRKVTWAMPVTGQISQEGFKVGTELGGAAVLELGEPVEDVAELIFIEYDVEERL